MEHFDEKSSQEELLRLVELRIDLQNTMTVLSPQERRVLELIYGLADGRPRTIAEILDEMN